jgi:hypothetical protein
MEKIMPSNNQSHSSKAKKAAINLGELILEVFQLPDGTYRLSQPQVAEAVGEDENSFREFLRSKAPEALPYKRFKAVKFSTSEGRGKINATPIKAANAYWKYQYRQNNRMAAALIDACMEESIERRADKAFGMQQSEEEYNQRFATRMNLRKVKFPQFVSAIAVWEREQGIYGTEVGKKWFRSAHDHMNVRLQSLKSHEIKAINGLPPHALIRDHFDVPVMIDYSSITQLAANFLRCGAQDPVEAVDLACDIYLPEGYVASPATIKENIYRVAIRLASLKQQAS